MNVNKRLVSVLLIAGFLLGGLLAGILITGQPNAAIAAPALQAGDADGAEDAHEGPDIPITGSALDQASAAALDYLGEGRVTETEVGDEEGYYEVEVTLDNGREVDVHLDEGFDILGQEAEGHDDD